MKRLTHGVRAAQAERFGCGKLCLDGRAIVQQTTRGAEVRRWWADTPEAAEKQLDQFRKAAGMVQPR